MAATDQNYRNQKGLDIVFGVSCVLMLLMLQSSSRNCRDHHLS